MVHIKRNILKSERRFMRLLSTTALATAGLLLMTMLFSPVVYAGDEKKDAKPPVEEVKAPPMDKELDKAKMKEEKVIDKAKEKEEKAIEKAKKKEEKAIKKAKKKEKKAEEKAMKKEEKAEEKAMKKEEKAEAKAEEKLPEPDKIK